MRETFNVYDDSKTDKESVVKILKEAKTQVLVNYLPVGSHDAVRFYAQCAIDAGCAFVNCMPEFIGSDKPKEWPKKFEKAGLPVLGDDIKSQVGATILHRNLVRLCLDRGVIIDETYQLNLGGDTDFQNMTVENRLISKRISKTEAVTSLVPYTLPTRIGPSDYVPFLKNKKICYISLKGRKFGDRPINISVKLEVEDSPNSAGVVIDLIRAAKIALDRKIAGALLSMPSYAFKHPHDSGAGDSRRAMTKNPRDECGVTVRCLCMRLSLSIQVPETCRLAMDGRLDSKGQGNAKPFSLL